MSIGMRLSKLDVARREVEYSIRLFFSSGDPTITHLIISSALEILRPLCRVKKISMFFDEMLLKIKPEKIEEVKKRLKDPYNFMKHARKDPEETIEFFPASNEYAIWDAIDMYHKLTSEVSGLMMSYRAWFYTKNADILIIDEQKRQFLRVAENINLDDKSLFLELASKLENRRLGN